VLLRAMMNVRAPKPCGEEFLKIQDAYLQEADAVVIGAGSGLSTSAGFTYSGERFSAYFSDFAAKYAFQDIRGSLRTGCHSGEGGLYQ
jgi:hypothetical protein